nr:hypothetical protein [Acinetobacter sp. Marseille-Q1620]
MPFQLIQLENNQANVSCPFCHTDIIDWSQEQYVQPCEHTLFVAMDLGFEYISDVFEASLPRTVDEIHDDPEMDMFAEISKSSITDFQVFRMDLGVKDMYRYVGVISKL